MVNRLAYDGVLFDLGNTLIPFTPKDSMEFVVKWYHTSNIKETEVPFTDFLQVFRNVVLEERERSDTELWESSVEIRSKMMKNELERKGFDIPNIEERLKSTHTGAFTTCLRIRHSSRYLLDILRSSTDRSGEPVRIGLISNAIDGKALRSFLDREGLTTYFDLIIISEEVRMAKPSKEIFQMALKELELRPEKSIYIGDRYKADILGPRSAGMDAVYIREYNTAGEPPRGVEIDAPIIKNILDLLPILESGIDKDKHG